MNTGIPEGRIHDKVRNVQVYSGSLTASGAQMSIVGKHFCIFVGLKERMIMRASGGGRNSNNI